VTRRAFITVWKKQLNLTDGFWIYFRAFFCQIVLMQVTLDIPEPLVKKFFSTTPARKRSSTVARLLRAELRRKELTAACLAANRDSKLNREVEDWQSFDESVMETVAS